MNTKNYQFSNFKYNATTHTAAWTLTATLAADRVFLSLDGDDASLDLNQGVMNSAGAFLAGGDVNKSFNVLPGDYNNNGVVTIQDSLAIHNKMPKYGGIYDIFADLDGDHEIDMDDFTAASKRIKKVLPTLPPV